MYLPKSPLRLADLIGKSSDVTQGKVCQERRGHKINKRLHLRMEHSFLPSTNYTLKREKQREGEKEGERA